jgi:hypothetical protein
MSTVGHLRHESMRESADIGLDRFALKFGKDVRPVRSLEESNWLMNFC